MLNNVFFYIFDIEHLGIPYTIRLKLDDHSYVTYIEMTSWHFDHTLKSVAIKVIKYSNSFS